MVATWTQPFHSRAPLGPSFVHVVSLGVDDVPFGGMLWEAEQFVLIFLHVQLELTLDSFCFKLSLYRYAFEISWVPLDPIRSQTSRVLHCAQLIFCPCTGGSFWLEICLVCFGHLCLSRVKLFFVSLLSLSPSSSSSSSSLLMLQVLVVLLLSSLVIFLWHV